MPSSRSFVVVTPCKDEELFARRTLESVTSQTAPPTQWIIVDDGSTDGTPCLLREYSRRHDYIRIVRIDRSTKRKVGPAVIEAFNAGLEAVSIDSFAYICKLDLDLELPPRYFELLLDLMEANPRLGSCSGKAYYLHGPEKKLVSEGIGDEIAVGASKFYRKRCFEQIGGFVSQVMWDGIDAHRCRMLGWQTKSIDDPELRFIHLRPMGSSQKSIWAGRVRHGFGQHFMGTHPTFMLASAIYRMTRPPLLIGGLGMLWGYFGSMLRRQPRYEDPEFRRFLRSYQWRCLLMGKRRATQLLDHRQASVWRPPASQGTLHQPGTSRLPGQAKPDADKTDSPS